MDETVKRIVAQKYGEDETPTRFRVWWNPQVPGKAFHSEEVTTFAAAKAIDATLGRYDIFQYENKIKPDFANAGGIEYWDEVEGEWVGIDESEYDEWEGK